MQVPYLMQIPELDELWLIDGEQRFLITPKIYDLLVSNGADLPPAYGIDALREQNAKLRKLAAEMYPYAKAFLQQGVMLGCNDSKSYDWFLQLRDLGVEV